MGYIGAGISRFNTADELTVTGDAEFNGNANFGDSDKAQFGAGNDLQIYHDGSNSYIDDAGAGDLFIRASNNHYLQFMNGDYAITTSEDGDVGLRYDNSQKLVTTSSGVNITGGLNTTSNVGIGTTAPAHNLEIVATAAGSVNDSLQIRNNATSSGTGSRIRFINSTDNTSDTNGASISSVRNGDDNDLVFETENATRMTIDHAGNVGIGSSAPEDFGGGYTTLEVAGSTTANGGIFKTATSDSAGTGTAGTEMLMYTNNGGGVIAVTSSDPLMFQNAGAERMRLDASGNLLVGKTAAGYQNDGMEFNDSSNKLFLSNVNAFCANLNRGGSDGSLIEFTKSGSTVGVIGTIGGDMVAGTGDTGLRFHDGADQVYPSNTDGSGRDGAIDIGNSGARFKDGYFNGSVFTTYVKGNGGHTGEVHFTGSHDIRFVTNGNERVRVTSGTELLVGMTGARGIGNVFDANCIELGAGYITLNRDDTASSAQITFGKNGAVAGSIVTTTSTTYNTTSDRRLKQDIEPLVATDKLMAMNPVSYSWKADPDGSRSMGFIAQEMQEVMPEAVSTGDDEDAMMSMDYGRITPILVSALQDAHRKIDELAAEIAELKAS